MRRNPREWSRQLWESLQFHVQPPNWDTVLGEKLEFGNEGNSAFLTLLMNSSSYLEFGSGASTLAAIQHNIPVVTVESDRRFLQAVKRRCLSGEAKNSFASMNFIHADIGATGPWGKPVFPSIPRRSRWRRYPLAPWDELGQDYRADVVLIDGRFRVATALSVILLQPDTEWTLLVDDYEGRDHYAPISHFAKFLGMRGRMAQFERNPHAKPESVLRAFQHFTSDWR